ncbi:hypothetical protein J437_LFUL007283, partial [Ladona fulva]
MILPRRVFIFYLVFYSILAGLFAAMMKCLLLTLDDNKPTYILSSSVIGTSPGLGYRPTAAKYVSGSSLIRYVSRSQNDSVLWVNDIDEFLEDYYNPETLPGRGKNIQNCSYGNPPEPGHVCAVDVSGWGPCTQEMGYGFNASTPCIFIKLNKIYGWVPDPLTDMEKLPEKMPASLKDVIRQSVANDPNTANTVWITCDGEGPADRENIGPLHYFPMQGFPGYYFPYTNTPGYLQPLVAVQFQNPTPNVLIRIECRAWAHNIKFHRQTQLGSCHIELMVDTNKGFY